MARPTKNYCDYFPHDRDMRNHRKIKALRTKFGIGGYGIWVMILEYLTGIDGNVFEKSDVELELMAGDFGVSATEITDVLDYCIRMELLFIKDGFIHSESLDDRLTPVYEKRKESKSKSKKQLRDNGRFCTINADNTVVSATETPQIKVNKSKEKEIIDNGTWESEKNLFLQAEQWQYNICGEYKLKKDELLGHIGVFLKRIELREDYQNQKELKRYFPNWYELQMSKNKGNVREKTAYEKEIDEARKNFVPIERV